MSIIFPGQPASYYSFGNGILGLNGYSIQAQPPVPATTAYELTLENDGHGTVSASTLSGFPGDSATLSTTPSTDYEFSGYDVTGGTIEGNTFIYGNTDATAKAWFKQAAFTITYQNDGHGTVTGPATAVPGSTVTLSTAYNTYYRFSGYQVTGGTINGNTLTVTGPCTVKAVFSANKFTASGGWWSNVAQDRNHSLDTMITYAMCSYKTSNVPASFLTTQQCSFKSSYTAYGTTTANITNCWTPSNVSAYKINGNASFTARNYESTTKKVNLSIYCGSTTITTGQGTWNSSQSTSFTKSFNTSTQGKPQAKAVRATTYYALGNCKMNGSWTATGYIP